MRRRPTLVRTVIGTTALATAIAGATFGITGQASAALGQASTGQASAGHAVTTTGAAAAAGANSTYVVLFAQGTDGAAAVAAAKAAGGTVVKVDRKLGFAVVSSADAAFAAKVDGRKGVLGAARDRVIGHATPDPRPSSSVDLVEAPATGQALADAPGRGHRPEPLANRQWDMRQIGATPERLVRRATRASKRVLVGIIDTGIDGSHPDIAPNFNEALSRNFVTDIPVHRRAVRGRRPASTRSTRTTTATARTWPAPSPRRSTASASPAWRPT